MSVDLEDDRPTKPAMWRGARLRCPNCGEGKLFSGYLKSADTCSECGEAFHHHRADDGPAYIIILVVGHFAGLLLHVLFEPLDRDPLKLLGVIVPFVVILSLVALPRVKGAMIGLQWAKRMHGFRASTDP